MILFIKSKIDAAAIDLAPVTDIDIKSQFKHYLEKRVNSESARQFMGANENIFSILQENVMAIDSLSYYLIKYIVRPYQVGLMRVI